MRISTTKSEIMALSWKRCTLHLKDRLLSQVEEYFGVSFRSGTQDGWTNWGSICSDVDSVPICCGETVTSSVILCSYHHLSLQVLGSNIKSEVANISGRNEFPSKSEWARIRAAAPPHWTCININVAANWAMIMMCHPHLCWDSLIYCLVIIIWNVLWCFYLIY